MLKQYVLFYCTGNVSLKTVEHMAASIFAQLNEKSCARSPPQPSEFVFAEFTPTMQIKIQNESHWVWKRFGSQQLFILWLSIVGSRATCAVMESGWCSWRLDKNHGELQYQPCSFCSTSFLARLGKLLHNVSWNRSKLVGFGCFLCAKAVKEPRKVATR